MIDAETWRVKRAEVLGEVLDEVDKLAQLGDLGPKEAAIMRATIRSLAAGGNGADDTQRGYAWVERSPASGESSIIPGFVPARGIDEIALLPESIEPDPPGFHIEGAGYVTMAKAPGPSSSGTLSIVVAHNKAVHVPISHNDSVEDICARINAAVGRQIAHSSADVERLFDAQDEASKVATQRALDAVEREQP